MLQLTWQHQVGFVYDLNSFEKLREFHYPGEGWAMTHDGNRIIVSDGTPEIRFWNPETLEEIGRLTITKNGVPLRNLNELEWVKGEIYANIWQTDQIARIDPLNGKVVGWVDLTGLLKPAERIAGPNGTDVLNGIAYDATGDRLFVTGKRWPKLYEIRLIKRSQ